MAVPLILGSLIKAQILEVVLQSKPFPAIQELQMRPIDYVAWLGALCS
jgi:hypothetical protein